MVRITNDAEGNVTIGLLEIDKGKQAEKELIVSHLAFLGVMKYLQILWIRLLLGVLKKQSTNSSLLNIWLCKRLK